MRGLWTYVLRFNLGDALLGSIGLIAALLVTGALKLLRIKHDWDLGEMAALFAMATIPVSVALLVVCRFFGWWPYSN